MNEKTQPPPREPDPSLTAWEVIRDCQLPDTVRHEAFNSLVCMNRGWWGRGTLLRFAQTTAFLTARRTLTGYGFSTDQVDWEGLAHEALLLLFRRADTVEREPRAWLVGVISNLVKQEVRANIRHMSACHMAASRSDVENPAHSEQLADGDQESRRDIVRLVQALDPSLRAVARLFYEGQLSRLEICAALGISRVALRKRIERIRRAFRSELSPKVAPSKENIGQWSPRTGRMDPHGSNWGVPQSSLASSS